LCQSEYVYAHTHHDAWWLAVGHWTCDLQVAGSIPSWSAFT